MVLFRSAVKQICRRHGYHATFMCRPKLPNVMSSGWHLHQSLRRPAHRRQRVHARDDKELLSRAGRNFLAGLLAHARAAAAFTTPTINGYKRYRSLLAGARPRDLGPRQSRRDGPRARRRRTIAATRLENRVGEPAANPYLYMASQILTGLDGMRAHARSRPVGGYALRDAGGAVCRKRSSEALARAARRRLLRRRLGADFVDYYVRIKDAEIARFQAEVTDWEQREYFELF